MVDHKNDHAGHYCESYQPDYHDATTATATASLAGPALKTSLPEVSAVGVHQSLLPLLSGPHSHFPGLGSSAMRVALYTTNGLRPVLCKNGQTNRNTGRE